MNCVTVTKLALAALAVCGIGQAKAGTLLTLINPPGQNLTPESLTFTAAATTTDITFAGYQAPERLWAYDISLTHGGGNLLGENWTFTPYNLSDNTDAGQFVDAYSTGTNALYFANGVGQLDEFDQEFRTVIGQTYTLDFLFSNYPLTVGAGNAPSELIVSANATPEPKSVILTVLGLSGLVLLSSRRLTS
jgi:hypothetical protein